MSIENVNNNGNLSIFHPDKQWTNAPGMAENKETTFANFKPNGESNVLGIKQNANDCKVSSANTQTVYIDERSQARKVQNRLTSNIGDTASDFLKQPMLKEKISAKFETQLESLSKCYKSLDKRINDIGFRFINLSVKGRFTLGSAIAKINNLLCHLNNDSVGGIDKLSTNKFKKSTMCLIGKEAVYDQAEEDLESKDPATRASANNTIKTLEGDGLIDKDVAKKNLNALRDNLQLYKNFPNLRLRTEPTSKRC